MAALSLLGRGRPLGDRARPGGDRARPGGDGARPFPGVGRPWGGGVRPLAGAARTAGRAGWGRRSPEAARDQRTVCVASRSAFARRLASPPTASPVANAPTTNAIQPFEELVSTIRSRVFWCDAGVTRGRTSYAAAEDTAIGAASVATSSAGRLGSPPRLGPRG